MGGEVFLIFDLDGTLLDTLEDLWASVNHALAQFSLPLRSMCEVRQFLGNGAKVLIHQSLPAEAPAELEERVFAAFRQHYLRHNQDNTHPYPGIIDMLRQCKALGYRTAIVSNKPNAAVQQLHQRFFADVIDIAIGEQQPHIRRKPAPDMVYAVLEQLKQLHPNYEHSVYIGDSEVDIATARAADLPCICVDWGFRDRRFLADMGATHIIHLPEELLTLIQSPAAD